jgi:hypothetical protein
MEAAGIEPSKIEIGSPDLPRRSQGEETRGVAAANAAAECAGKSPPRELGPGSRDGRSWRRRESNPRKIPAGSGAWC